MTSSQGSIQERFGYSVFGVPFLRDTRAGEKLPVLIKQNGYSSKLLYEEGLSGREIESVGRCGDSVFSGFLNNSVLRCFKKTYAKPNTPFGDDSSKYYSMKRMWNFEASLEPDVETRDRPVKCALEKNQMVKTGDTKAACFDLMKEASHDYYVALQNNRRASEETTVESIAPFGESKGSELVTTRWRTLEMSYNVAIDPKIFYNITYTT